MSDALSAYNRAKTINPSSAVARSSMWAGLDKIELFEKGRRSSLIEAVHLAQEGRIISLNHFTNVKTFGFTIDEMLSYLESENFNLHESPPHISESAMSNPKILAEYRGRLISTDFLYRLSICTRIWDIIVQRDRRIFEIGAGLGSLARVIKLINSSVRYCIVDLPDTLFFSYIFLRANFPHLSFKFITSQEDLKSLDNLDRFDFVFIPSDLYEFIPKWEIDLVINTHSLGEMRQEAVLTYMDLIQTRLNVKYFYSLNRYLHESTVVDNNRATCSVVLDCFWKVRLWNFIPTFVAINRDPSDPIHTLELLVERVPENERSKEYVMRQSMELLTEANRIKNIKSHRWHRLMWESVYLYPCRDNVEPYYKFLVNANCREHRYYRKIIEELQISFPQPPSLTLTRKTFRRIIAGGLRRIASKVIWIADKIALIAGKVVIIGYKLARIGNKVARS